MSACLVSGCDFMDLQSFREIYGLNTLAAQQSSALVFTDAGGSGMSTGARQEPPRRAVLETPRPSAVGESCVSPADPARLCIGLKYTVYVSGSDRPEELRQDAIESVLGANRIWSACEIAFQIDQFVPVDPKSYHLRFRTADYRELETIRRDFDDDRSFLVVATGDWDRHGSLGNTGANAWTNMPGDALHGAVLERWVSGIPNMLAHELGHYLSLDHTDDPRNLMYPQLFDDTEELTRTQCQSARWAAKHFWPKMLRSGG
jgi:hypothetical protein